MDGFARSAVDFSKRIVKLEVQCKRLKEENDKLREEVTGAKGKTEEMKEKYAKMREKFVRRKDKFDSEERKWREEEERLTEIGWQLETEKKKIEDNLRASAAEALRCVAKKLREVEAEAEAMKSLMEEKDAKITSLFAKNEMLERCRSRLETRKKVEEEKILELTKKIQALEGEKGQLETEICKVKEDNRSKDEKICVLERAKETEKRAIEDEGKKKVSELHHRIKVLESEKKEVEDEFSLFVENSEEITRIMNQRSDTIAAKTTLEAESKKYVLELIQRIEVLEREKTEMEAEVIPAKTRKKRGEIASILKDKHKEISNLVYKSDVLESRKHRLEAQNREVDERIKVLVKERECLVGTKKKMGIEKNSCVVKLKEGVELFESMHLDASNIGTTSTTTTQNEDPDYVVASDTEPKENSDSGLQSRGLLISNIPERKVEGLGCTLANETNRCTVNSREDAESSQPLHPDACNVDRTITSTTQNGVSSPFPSPSTSSPYEKMEIETDSCVVMSKVDVELPQSVHLDASNADISTATAQNQGPEHIDVSDNEPKDCSGLLGSRITKRKVEELGCSGVNQVQTKCCKLDGLTECNTLQHRLEAQKEQVERIKMLVQEKQEGGNKTKMYNEMNKYGVSSEIDVELPQPVHQDACNVVSTSAPTTQNRVSFPFPATSSKRRCPGFMAPQPTSKSSRYENQKRRDWNSFGKYLRNHKPDLTLSSCSGHHVREYLLYLDQFGKTRVHAGDCLFYGHPNPSDPCPCPIRQGWGSLDALTGRLRAAYEENGGKPEDNPFGTLIVRHYLLEVKDSQSKARGVSYMKKRKNPPKDTNSHMPPLPGTC